MHEFGLCEGIVEAVLKRAGDREVTGVRIRAGVMQRLVPEALEMAFRSVSAGTLAESAAVELEVVSVTISCRTCQAVGEVTDPYACCPACGSDDVDTSGGDELTLVSVSLRAPEASATG